MCALPSVDRGLFFLSSLRIVAQRLQTLQHRSSTMLSWVRGRQPRARVAAAACHGLCACRHRRDDAGAVAGTAGGGVGRRARRRRRQGALQRGCHPASVVATQATRAVADEAVPHLRQRGRVRAVHLRAGALRVDAPARPAVHAQRVLRVPCRGVRSREYGVCARV